MTTQQETAMEIRNLKVKLELPQDGSDEFEHFVATLAEAVYQRVKQKLDQEEAEAVRDASRPS